MNNSFVDHDANSTMVSQPMKHTRYETPHQLMPSHTLLRKLLPFVVVWLMLTASTAPLSAENWPYWRGPTNNGISSETNLPSRWSRTESVAWRLKLPGPAGATPVIWNNHVFLTAPEGDDLLLICVGTDGQRLWRRKIDVGNETVEGDEANACSPSPVTDGQHVWTLMTTGAMACYDFSGNEIWKLNLQQRYGRYQIEFSMTSTPVLDGDRLYLQLIHGDRDPQTQEAVVAAIDKSTGAEIWRQTRATGASGKCEHSYASPMLYDVGTTRFLISHGADYVIAHALSDGREIWRCGGLNPRQGYSRSLRFVASPAAAPGIIVAPSAKGGRVLAIRPDSRGDITDSRTAKLWQLRRGAPDVPSPLIHDGLVYLCRENGNLVCLDASTGEEYYRQRTHRARHRASPVYADGKIYLTARDGKVSVIAAGRRFKLLAQNELNEPMSSSPAVSNGTIYLRSFDTLWAIRQN